MAEMSLITIADVSNYRKIDPKTNQDKFDALLMEAQRRNLRELLGQDLYYDFFENITDSKYVALRDGEPYEVGGITRNFYGIKPYLCYCYLALSAKEGDLFHSSYGAVQFTNNPQQNFDTYKDKDRVYMSYMEVATSYKNDIVRYLDENSSTYTLWEATAKSNPVNFISFKV